MFHLYWLSFLILLLIPQAVSEEKYEEMVAEQLEKLKQEKIDRERNGASTPPSPAQPGDPVDTRQVHILFIFTYRVTKEKVYD